MSDNCPDGECRNCRQCLTDNLVNVRIELIETLPHLPDSHRAKVIAAITHSYGDGQWKRHWGELDGSQPGGKRDE